MHFTKQERQVFLFLAVSVFFGLALNLSLKSRWDQLSWVHVLDDPSFYPKININRALFDEIVNVPGIGERTANLILERRPFQSLEELRSFPGMGGKKFQMLKKCLKVR